MNRHDGRAPSALRPVRLEPNWLKTADGSVLISVGETRVLCAATLEEKVPPFLKDTGEGWVTAEYSMLPAATSTRTELAKCSTPALLALYDDAPVPGTKAAADDTTRMYPRRSSTAGNAARTSASLPKPMSLPIALASPASVSQPGSTPSGASTAAW